MHDLSSMSVKKTVLFLILFFLHSAVFAVLRVELLSIPQSKLGEDKAGEDKAGENKAGENKTGENKTGKNKTGVLITTNFGNKTSKVFFIYNSVTGRHERLCEDNDHNTLEGCIITGSYSSMLCEGTGASFIVEQGALFSRNTSGHFIAYNFLGQLLEYIIGFWPGNENSCIISSNLTHNTTKQRLLVCKNGSWVEFFLNQESGNNGDFSPESIGVIDAVSFYVNWSNIHHAYQPSIHLRNSNNSYIRVPIPSNFHDYIIFSARVDTNYLLAHLVDSTHQDHQDHNAHRASLLYLRTGYATPWGEYSLSAFGSNYIVQRINELENNQLSILLQPNVLDYLPVIEIVVSSDDNQIFENSIISGGANFQLPGFNIDAESESRFRTLTELYTIRAVIGINSNSFHIQLNSQDGRQYLALFIRSNDTAPYRMEVTDQQNAQVELPQSSEHGEGNAGRSVSHVDSDQSPLVLERTNSVLVDIHQTH